MDLNEDSDFCMYAEFGHTVRNDLVKIKLSALEQTEYKILKKSIVKNIEKECPGQTDKLKEFLRRTYGFSDSKCDCLLGRQVEIAGNYSSNDVIFKIKYYSIENERRQYGKEAVLCLGHHCSRSFSCGRSGNRCSNCMYQCVRFSCLCCWTSYVWRLACYNCTSAKNVEERHESPKMLYMRYLLTHCCCCFFFFCYYYDKRNFETRVSSMSGPAAEFHDGQATLTRVTQPKPTRPFHYDNRFFNATVYAAVEVRPADSIANHKNMSLFWIKLPFDYNVNVESTEDPDLY